MRRKDERRAEKVVKDNRGKPVIGKDGKPMKTWASSLAKAGKQHIASGASRLRPVVDDAAKFGGKIAFTVRAKKGAFKHDAYRKADSPGLRRNVVQRRDGTEERAYADNRGGPGSGEEGFDGAEFKAMVDAAAWGRHRGGTKVAGRQRPHPTRHADHRPGDPSLDATGRLTIPLKAPSSSCSGLSVSPAMTSYLKRL